MGQDYKQFYPIYLITLSNIFNNLRELNEFLQIHHLAKQTQNKIENLNSSNSIEVIELTVKCSN